MELSKVKVGVMDWLWCFLGWHRWSRCRRYEGEDFFRDCFLCGKTELMTRRKGIDYKINREYRSNKEWIG